MLNRRIRMAAMGGAATRPLQIGLRYFARERKEAEVRAEQRRLEALDPTGAFIIRE